MLQPIEGVGVSTQAKPTGKGRGMVIYPDDLTGEINGFDDREHWPDDVRELFDAFRDELYAVRDEPTIIRLDRPNVRAPYHAFAAAYWKWRESDNARASDAKAAALPPIPPLPTNPQQEVSLEVRELTRGFTLAPHGLGWTVLMGQFALILQEGGRSHSLRIEGPLLSEWWGKPRDEAALLVELQGTKEGQSLILNALALVVSSESPRTDVDLDELIKRVGLDPRSKAERKKMRERIYRTLSLIGATRVVGQRRHKTYDPVQKRNVKLVSQDPLLIVTPWREAGTQLAFDAGEVPLRVSLFPGPLIAQHRGNNRILQSCGALLAVSAIPAGKPSGAWARAIGFALQQLWREGASRANYRRAGDDGHTTARFKPFTRKQLLEEIFMPERPPSLDDVLKGSDPSRAIEYWDAAIQILRTNRIIGHYSGANGATLRDWASDRPRKGWAGLWRAEELDIRPVRETAEELSTIASAGKQIIRKALARGSRLRKARASGPQ
jgi:hypothetical protein